MQCYDSDLQRSRRPSCGSVRRLAGIGGCRAGACVGCDDDVGGVGGTVAVGVAEIAADTGSWSTELSGQLSVCPGHWPQSIGAHLVMSSGTEPRPQRRLIAMWALSWPL